MARPGSTGHAGAPLGGTAVGSGLNTPPGFATAVAKVLAQRTATAFHPADNLFAVMAGHDSLFKPWPAAAWRSAC